MENKKQLGDTGIRVLVSEDVEVDVRVAQIKEIGVQRTYEPEKPLIYVLTIT